MASSRLQSFCTPLELQDWIKLLSSQKELGILTFSRKEKSGVIYLAADDFTLNQEVYFIYLFPQDRHPIGSITINNIKPRRWGWISINNGQLRTYNNQQILTMTDIVGEDFDYEEVHPAKYVRWLKRKLKSEKKVKAGVLARNILLNTNGSLYSDVWITPGAISLFKSGILLKQTVDGKVIFEPLDETF
jgi:hypothetical protein